MCRKRYNQTYDKTSDSFPHYILLIPASILSILFHSNLNGVLITDVYFYTFLDSLDACINIRITGTHTTTLYVQKTRKN